MVCNVKKTQLLRKISTIFCYLFHFVSFSSQILISRAVKKDNHIWYTTYKDMPSAFFFLFLKYFDNIKNYNYKGK